MICKKVFDVMAHHEAEWPWASEEIFLIGDNVDLLLSFSDYSMQIDVHKTLYPLCTTKKMRYVTASVTNIALRWRSNGSFSLMLFSYSLKLHDLPLSAVTVSLDYLRKMSAFNSHMRLKSTFEDLLLYYAIKIKSRTTRSQVSLPASAGKGADVSRGLLAFLQVPLPAVPPGRSCLLVAYTVARIHHSLVELA